MKWVLIDKFDDIVHTVDLNKRYTQEEAQRYFVNLKQISYENFIQIWKVMTEDEHVVKQAKKPIEWWIEDKEITDSELKF